MQVSDKIEVAGGWCGVEKERTWQLIMVHALWYVEHGYPVLPLRPESKISSGRHLGSGWSYTSESPGTLDPAQVREWWGREPLANIGIQMGRGAIVLDCDRKLGRPNGLESLGRWAAKNEVKIPTLPGDANVVDTPSGGVHVWLRLPPGCDAEAAVRKHDGWLPGVDVGGLGSLCAVAPSHRKMIFPDRGEGASEIHMPYRWRGPRVPPRLADLPEVPKEIIDSVRVPGRAVGGGDTWDDGDGERLPRTDHFTREGFGAWGGSVGRNDDCFRLACRLWVRHDFNVDEVMAILYDAWVATTSRDDPGREFRWDEVLGAARSAHRAATEGAARESKGLAGALAWLGEREHETGGRR